MKIMNIFGILFFGISMSAAHGSFDDLNAHIQIQNQKQKLVLKSLLESNRKVKSLVIKKGELQSEIDSLQASIDSLDHEVVEIEKRVHDQRIQLAKRIATMGNIAQGGWAQFFFSRQKAPDFERNLRVLKIISQRDRELIQNYQEDTKALKSKKERLVSRRTLIEKKQELFLKQEVSLFAEISKKNQVLARIKKSKAFSEKKIKELKQLHSSMNLDDSGVLDGLLAPSFSEKKGTLPAPLNQFSVLRKYGIIQTPHYVIKNRGVFLQAELGEKVRTVGSGTVILSDYLPGKGQTVIVDHGEHYYSVYSNLDQAPVRRGQTLASGDVIGQTGYSSMNETTGLYFELRHFSEAYDPGQWVKGLKL